MHRYLLSITTLIFSALQLLHAQQPDLRTITVQDIALVQTFGGGTPLTAREQADIAAAIRQTFTTSPKAATAAAIESQQLTLLLKNRVGTQMAVLLQGGRRAIAFTSLQALSPEPLTATAARIVNAHDPVVASDRAKQYLVTEQTVRALVEGNRRAAVLFNVPAPPPSPVAEQTLAASIRLQWPTVDDGLRDSLSNAQRNLFFADPYFANSPPAARAKFIATWRPKIMAGSDAAAKQFNLAEVFSFVGKTGFQNRGSLGRDSIARAHNNQTAIDRAGRSLMPGCGTPAGSVMSPERRSFCNPMPLP